MQSGLHLHVQILLCVQKSHFGGAAILFADSRTDNVFDVQHISERILFLKLIIDKGVLTFLCIQQLRQLEAEKECVYDQMQYTVNKVPLRYSSQLVTERSHRRYRWYIQWCMASMALEPIKLQVKRVLEFSITNCLCVGNTGLLRGTGTWLHTAPTAIQYRSTTYSITKVFVAQTVSSTSSLAALPAQRAHT